MTQFDFIYQVTMGFGAAEFSFAPDKYVAKTGKYLIELSNSLWTVHYYKDGWNPFPTTYGRGHTLWQALQAAGLA